MASIFKRKNGNGTSVWRAVIRSTDLPKELLLDVKRMIDEGRASVALTVNV